MEERVKKLVEKWESEYNNEVKNLDRIRDYVSGEFLRRMEYNLDQKLKFINELKETI